MADNASSLRIEAPVSLVDCQVEFLDDGSTYIVHKPTEERLCKAYGYEEATSDWRSKTSFWTKAGEEGFWATYDDRKTVRTLD